MKSLPKNPNLEYLKKQAKALRQLHRDRKVKCCSQIRKFDSSFADKSNQEVLDTRFTVMDSQRIIARVYGYSSWTKLTQYIESLANKI